MIKQLPKPTQSIYDSRQIKVFQLANRLKCVLVSDPQANKFAGSISVNVGSIDDPKGTNGLAHFLQHMIFMGTEKYPDEKEFSQFINKNSGQTNAYTDEFVTNYTIDVNNQACQEAFDRLADFFKSPKFYRESVDKQVQAVNSQFCRGKVSEYSRCYNLIKILSNPDAQFNHFQCGNSSTLKVPDIRQQLLKFYQQHYSSNLMAAALIGNFPLDKLQQIAVSSLSSIPDNDKTRKACTVAPFRSQDLPIFCKCVPLSQKEELWLVFPFSSFDQDEKQNPGNYLQMILGHQGKNSLLAALIAEDLAVQLTSEYDRLHKYTAFMILSIELTQRGQSEFERVLRICFSYLRAVSKAISSRPFFQQYQTLNQIQFQNKINEGQYSTVEDLCNSIHEVSSTANLLNSEFLVEEFKQPLLQHAVSFLRPGNCLVIHKSKSFQPQCNLLSPHYETKYCLTKFPQSVLAQWDQGGNQPTKQPLGLPPLNKFFPKRLGLILVDDAEPRVVFSRDSICVYHKSSKIFKRNNASVHVKFFLKESASPKRKAFLKLFSQMVHIGLKELLQEGIELSMHSNISFESEAVSLSCYGLSETLLEYSLQLIKGVISIELHQTNQLFDKAKEKTIKSVSNSQISHPSSFIRKKVKFLLFDRAQSHSKQLLHQIQQFSFLDLQNQFASVFGSLAVTCLINGNVLAQQSERFGISLKEIIHKDRLKKEDRFTVRGIELKFQKEIYSEKHENPANDLSMTVLIFQLGPISSKDVVLALMYENCLGQETFNYLRTDRQLGYLANGRKTIQKNLVYFIFEVEGPKLSPAEVSEVMKEMMTEFREKVNNYDDQEFMTYRSSVENSLKEKNLNAQDEGYNLWKELNQFGQFGKVNQQLDILNSLTKQQFVDQFNRQFFTQRRTLEVHIVGAPHQTIQDQKADQLSLIKDVHKWKSGSVLLPDYSL